MDEYISREKVLETIRYRVCQGQGNKEHMCKRGSCAYCGIMEIMSDISSIEAADVQPVKHGRWIVTKTERGWNCAEYPVEWTCSECNVANDREDDFCPHCGNYNRMDGDSE